MRMLQSLVTEPWKAKAGARLLGHLPPHDAALRFLRGDGVYPWDCSVRVGRSRHRITLDSHDDFLTFYEVFGRRDYSPLPGSRTFVDAGANIGLSSLYFASQHQGSFVLAFEPLERNADRYLENTARLRDRVVLVRKGIAGFTGTARFGREPTGRYGGVGLETGDYVEVELIDVADALGELVEQEGVLDLVKIDIESLEDEVIARLHGSGLHRHIRRLIIEHRFEVNPFIGTHYMEKRVGLARFTALGEAAADYGRDGWVGVD